MSHRVSYCMTQDLDVSPVLVSYIPIAYLSLSQHDRDGCVMFCNEGGKRLPVYEHAPCTKGVVNPEFKKKYNV